MHCAHVFFHSAVGGGVSSDIVSSLAGWSSFLDIKKSFDRQASTCSFFSNVLSVLKHHNYGLGQELSWEGNNPKLLEQ